MLKELEKVIPSTMFITTSTATEENTVGMKYFLRYHNTRKLVVATKTQKEMIGFIKEELA